MWKTFIDRGAVSVAGRLPLGLLTGLLVGLMQGCVSSGGEPADTAPHSAAQVVGDLAAGQPLPPPPAVAGRNAELFARATELLQQSRWTQAETLLLTLTADQPELSGPWVNLAQVYVAQGREGDATAALEQAVLANPANCAARTDLGVLLRRQGDFAGAEAHYLACLDYQPEYRAAYLNLGILYDLYLGRLADALHAYRQYQTLAAEPDRRVNVWVVDLERRIGS